MAAMLAALATLVRQAMAASSWQDFRAQLPVQLSTEPKRCFSKSALRPARSSVSSGTTPAPAICHVRGGRTPTTCPG